jgi:hypothetical protein
MKLGYDSLTPLPPSSQFDQFMGSNFDLNFDCIKLGDYVSFMMHERP